MRVTDFLKLRTLMYMLIIGLALIVGSCKDDDDDNGGADKTNFNALMEQADELAAEASAVDYPQTAIDAFRTSITSIKNEASGNRTQAEINTLVAELNEAMNTFESKAYGFIDETVALIAGWDFDEGSGTTATAFSPTKHIATFAKGNAAIFGNDAMDPGWVEDVDMDGKAIYLNNGAHLEVPYTPAFLPSNLSISVWINPAELYGNNYIVSQNFSQGYNLRTQGGKPFFTYKKADGGIVDADNEADNSIKANDWNHLVVTLDGTTKELKFYVNGILSKTWTESDKGVGPITQALTAPDPQPFLIGASMTGAPLDTTTATPATFGYFKGAIDELKIYNRALLELQVSKLYTDEKPTE